jgi:hypothetical protein
MRRKQLQPWVGLPNILCRDFVVPELLQDNATPELLAAAVLEWLDRHLTECGRATDDSHAARPSCGATPQHWQPMRSSKVSKAEQTALSWDPGLMAGVDEAGAARWPGRWWPPRSSSTIERRIRGLADSKKLTRCARSLYDKIREKALCCSIAMATVEEIDS